MAARIPKIHPISDLAREAKRLVEYARKHQEPIVITQRGRDAAVLVPIELYRKMESRMAYRVMSPRLYARRLSGLSARDGQSLTRRHWHKDKEGENAPRVPE